MLSQIGFFVVHCHLNNMEIQNLKFVRRPSPLNPEYRPLYKISLLLLILKIASRGNTSSLLKLHFFSWMIKTREGRQTLTTIVQNETPQLPIFNIEPSLNQALLYMLAEGLIIREKDNYSITQKGEILVNELIANEESFIKEKSFLKVIGKKFTESKVDEMLNRLNK